MRDPAIIREFTVVRYLLWQCTTCWNA